MSPSPKFVRSDGSEIPIKPLAKLLLSLSATAKIHSMKVCSIEDCDRPAAGRGWCKMHWKRWRKSGDPLAVKFVRQPNGTPLKERLERRSALEPETGCMLWRGAADSKLGARSYTRGIIRMGGGNLHVGQAAWIVYCGPIPSGLWVLHHCDNALCINPQHLYLGTRVENGADMAKRRRARHLKLTEEQVRFIRASALNGAQLGRMFGVSRILIYPILKGRFHRHVI